VRVALILVPESVALNGAEAAQAPVSASVPEIELPDCARVPVPVVVPLAEEVAKFQDPAILITPGPELPLPEPLQPTANNAATTRMSVFIEVLLFSLWGRKTELDSQLPRVVIYTVSIAEPYITPSILSISDQVGGPYA